MEAPAVFKAFLDDLHSAFPDSVSIHDIDVESTAQYIEKEFFPSVLKIFQKDSAFFTEKERVLMGVNLSEIWGYETMTDATRESIWKHLLCSLIASFLHGGIKDKIGSIMSTFKTMWSGKDDEISKILNDEESEGHIKSLMDYVTETRLAKIFMDVVETIDISDIEIDISNPTEIIDMVKNPEHPVMKKIISKIQGIIQNKLQTGAITQAQIQSEIEGVKARVQSTFGNIFNDALGGNSNRTNTPSAVLLGNSPEARRQRMIARLQKKQLGKKS